MKSPPIPADSGKHLTPDEYAARPPLQNCGNVTEPEHSTHNCGSSEIRSIRESAATLHYYMIYLYIFSSFIDTFHSVKHVLDDYSQSNSLNASHSVNTEY